MSHKKQELLQYEHQELMDELNEMFVRIKYKLFDLPSSYPKLTIEEMDSLHMRINRILMEDSKPLKKT